MLPAFAHASRNSELAALVSDDDVKLRPTLAREKRLPPVRRPELVHSK